ncbi:MAG: hypothetical protein NTX17_05025 [Candidatus Eisenbacteria bacterium]|nr:hypothetical protein [Candidatus Eisenbacteria bacterium]
MAHAYTPGVTVTARTKLVRERRLPLAGTVLAKVGDQVKAEQVVARTELPGNVQTVNVANILSVLPEDVGSTLTKPVGSPLNEGEVFAMSKGFFGLFTSKCKSPINGTLESISNITGQAILREPPIPVEVHAYVDGKVIEAMEREGVKVETECSFLQGIFGIGGETWGEIKLQVGKSDEPLDVNSLDAGCAGKILVGGSRVDNAFLEKAASLGVRGVVVGGIDDKDLRQFLGYDLGVAITGSEEKGISLIITEGFGGMRMAEKTFSLLRSLEGRKASMSGVTQIRAGVMRPEVIVSMDGRTGPSAGKGSIFSSSGLEVGSAIRVIREPHFGRLGRVADLPPELRMLETEAKVRVLEVEFEDGTKAVMPRANVEMIEG